MLSPAAGAPCPLGSPGLCWVVKDAASLSQSGEGTELPIPFPQGDTGPSPALPAGPQMAPRISAGALPAPLGPPAADTASPEEFLLPGESKGQGASRWPVWTPCQDCTPSVMLWHQACPWQVQVRGPFSAGPWEGPTPFLLQLQPQERWFVTGGARIWGTMAALHVHLLLPGCSHRLALLSIKGSHTGPWGLPQQAPGQDGPSATSSTLPFSPSTCWGRADFFIQNCKVSPHKCPQGREPLFWPSEQGTHKLGDEGSRLLLLNKNHMAGMCVY